MENLENNFAEHMRNVLYGKEGFYTKGHGAGRTRDYITSPEVGDLFGFVVGSYIDRWYESLETDGRAIVVDAGCGPGSLVASIARSKMRNADNIIFYLVDISSTHQENSRKLLSNIDTGFDWSVHSEIPECEYPTLVLANELLDNLVFDISTVEKVNLSNDIGNFRIPLHVGITEFMQELSVATAQVSSLSILFFDYMKNVEQMSDENWLRLYNNNQRIVGVDNVLDALEKGATGDITTDVTIEDMRLILDQHGFSKVRLSTQAQWLISNGIEYFCRDTSKMSLYDQAQAFAKGEDLSQTRGFALEKDTLLDPNSLGGFGVFEAIREI